MTEQDRKAALAEWMKTRPACVQQLAAEFPPGTAIDNSGERLFVVGWNESDMLIVSATDPCVDYDKALATKTYLCAEHLRSGS